MSSSFPPSGDNPYQPPTNSGGAYEPFQQQPPNNLAVAALIVGILGIVFICCPLIGFPVNLAAIVMGAMSMKPPNKGMAIGGLVCGIIGMIGTLINAIVGVIIQMNGVNQGNNPFGP